LNTQVSQGHVRLTATAGKQKLVLRQYKSIQEKPNGKCVCGCRANNLVTNIIIIILKSTTSCHR